MSGCLRSSAASSGIGSGGRGGSARWRVRASMTSKCQPAGRFDRSCGDDVERAELRVEIKPELLLHVAPGRSAQHPAVAGWVDLDEMELAGSLVAQHVHAKRGNVRKAGMRARRKLEYVRFRRQRDRAALGRGDDRGARREPEAIGTCYW